jgi:hypothetical protein
VTLVVNVHKLPTQKFLESYYHYAKRVEEHVNCLLELVPHDYNVKAEVKQVSFISRPNGVCLMVFLVELEELPKI